MTTFKQNISISITISQVIYKQYIATAGPIAKSYI